jgi:hypothetical protein
MQMPKYYWHMLNDLFVRSEKKLWTGLLFSRKLNSGESYLLTFHISIHSGHTKE